MGEERRKHPRHRVSLECSWQGNSRIAELSPGGCYVDCHFVPDVGQRIDMEIVFDVVATEVCGRVLYAQPGLGFGLRFTDLSVTAQERLSLYIASLTGI